MKICMLVHQNFFQDERVRRYTESLLDQGNSVDVICPSNPQYSGMIQGAKAGVHTIPVVHKSNGRTRELLWEYFRALILYFLKLTGLYLKNHYQIIHVHNMPDALVFAAIIPRLFGAKVILDIHDPMPEFFQSKFASGNGGFFARIIRLEEKISIWFVNAVIAANHNFRNNLILRGVPEGKITVVRNFPNRMLYDPAKYVRQPAENRFLLMYPGTIAPRYGLDVAIRGVKLLAEKFPQLELWIIGPDSEHKTELIQLTQELQVGERVKFFPPIPSNQVAERLAQADAGVYPAIPDAHMDIAIPTKVLEFTVMGLPVIASRITVIEQLFPAGLAYLFTPGSVQEFADCVEQVISNPDEVKQKLANIEKELLPLWTWDAEAEKYFALLTNLVK